MLNATNDCFPSAALEKFYSHISYQDVPVILDFAEPSGIQYAQLLKGTSTPFIIKGHQGWAKFASSWLIKTNPDMFGSPIFEVDIDAIKRDIGNEKVPVLTPDHDSENPIKTHISVSE